MKIIENNITDEIKNNWYASEHEIGKDILILTSDVNGVTYAASIWVNNHDLNKQLALDNFYELQVATVFIDEDSMEVDSILLEEILDRQQLYTMPESDIIAFVNDYLESYAN